MPTGSHSHGNRCGGIEPKFNRHRKQTRKLFPPNRGTEVTTSCFLDHPAGSMDEATLDCVSKQVTH